MQIINNIKIKLDYIKKWIIMIKIEKNYIIIDINNINKYIQLMILHLNIFHIHFYGDISSFLFFISF